MIILGKIPKKHYAALHYYAKELFTPQKLRHIAVQVKYLKNKDKIHGEVSVDDYNVLNMPISFLIEVYRDTEEEMLKTLAHEMVHVLQYARGELNEEMTYWRGKKVNSDLIPYNQQPWEIEAETKGIQLYEKFMMKNKND
jgi:hypothetical protein